MTTPSVNATTNVEVNDSCNCCWFWRRRKPKQPVITVTEEVFKRTVIREESTSDLAEGTRKDLQSREYSQIK